MSLDVDLTAALAPIFPIPDTGSPPEGRVYPSTFPQGFTQPALRFTFIDITPLEDICGDGDDDTAEPRVQFDIVAHTFKQVSALRLQVMAVMRTFTPPARLVSSAFDYDVDSKSHRATMDYTFHGSSTT